MRLKPELLQLFAVVAAIALSNAVPLNRFDSDGNNLRLDRRNSSFDSEFGSVCVIDDVLYQIGDYVPPTTPCERCICEPPTISCSPLPCDFKPSCKALKMSDQCCTIYQCECEHNGRVYQNGERLENPEDPCNVCYCRGGEVSCTTIECYRRDDCEPQYVPGRCCPKYDHCPPIDQPRLEKTRPQFIRTDFNRDTTVSIDTSAQHRIGLFDLDNEASEDVTATAITTEILEQHSSSSSTTPGVDQEENTVKQQTTDASPTHSNDHLINIKPENIGDEVMLTADDSESELSESRKVPSNPKLIPVTHQPTEEKFSSVTSLSNSEEGSGTTTFTFNDGSISSSTESIEAGSGTKTEFDVGSGDGEGSGAEEIEPQTERNIDTTLTGNNPSVHIISETTSESSESNEVVTDSTTLDYPKIIAKKQQSESTKSTEELLTATEIPKTSPIDDIRIESFLVNEKSNTEETTESQEIEAVTKKNDVYLTNPSEDSKTTDEDVTESNELDVSKTTTNYDVILESSSDEVRSESDNSKTKEPDSLHKGKDELESNGAEIRSATLTDQDNSETKEDASPTVATPVQASLTTLLERDEIVTSTSPAEVEKGQIISSSSEAHSTEKELVGEQAQQETVTESFVNLENELPVLSIGSVLMNNEMDVVLATTEIVKQTDDEEILSASSALQTNESASSTETETGEIATEETATQSILGVLGVQRSSGQKEEAQASGSDIYQRLVLITEPEIEQTTEVTTIVENDLNSGETTTTTPVLIKLSPLLTDRAGDESSIQATESSEKDTLPTTTEVNLQDETVVNEELFKSLKSQELNQEINTHSDEDLTTLASNLEEITATTDISESTNADDLTGVTNLEETTTVLPDTTVIMDQPNASHSPSEEILVREATDSFITEESATTSTEEPKLARTVSDEASTFPVESENKESRETTTFSFSETTTTETPESFDRLASDTSNINVNVTNSESTITTKTEFEDVTEHSEKALFRDASSDQSESDDRSIEVTTTSSTEHDSTNTNSDDIETEIFQEGTTEFLGVENTATEQIEGKQSGLNAESTLDEMADSSASFQATTQQINAEETTHISNHSSLLEFGSSNLREKVAVKLLEEPKTEVPLSDDTTTEQQNEAEGLTQSETEALPTSTDEYTTKLLNKDTSSTILEETTIPIESSTLIPEQSEQKDFFSESEAPRSITVSLEESLTTLPTSLSGDAQESTTELYAEETTAKDVHSTNNPPSSTVNIKREIANSEHSSNQPKQSTEISMSQIFSDDSLPEKRLDEIFNTEEQKSLQVGTTESPDTSLNYTKTDVPESREETYDPNVEQSTTLSSILSDSTEQSIESSTKSNEETTNIPMKYGGKKEEIARLVHSVTVSVDNNHTDSETESTTLPKDWLKSDNISETTNIPDHTVEAVTDAEEKENLTSITEFTTQTDIQELLVTEETTAATTSVNVEEESAFAKSHESNSTEVSYGDQNDGKTSLDKDEGINIKEHKHTVKARSVDNFDLDSGNDNGFMKESVPSTESHSSFIHHINSYVKDSEDFPVLDDFFTRLFHRQDVNQDEDLANM